MFLKLIFTLTCLFSITQLISNEDCLSWERAVFEMVESSPKLKMENAQISGLKGLILQSSFTPNPIFSYSVENVLGAHHWTGWGSSESRYEFVQPFELGGKKNLRVCLAKALHLAEQADLEALTLYLLHELHHNFVKTKAAEEFFLLSLDQEELQKNYFDVIFDKVENGKASHLERRKAEIRLSSAKIKKEKACLEFKRLKEKLAKTIGFSRSCFQCVEYPFFRLDPFSDLCEYSKNIDHHPSLVRASLKAKAAYHQYQLEKSAAIPDLAFLVGYKTNQECGDKGMILGASLPIPIYNQNQGNIKRASFAYYEADAHLDEVKNDLEKALSDAYYSGESALNEALAIKQNLLDEAFQGYLGVKEGYESGKFDIFNLIEAKSIYLEMKERYLNALLEYHLRVGDIEYLTYEDNLSL